MKDTKQCPFCSEDIKFEAIKCKHCWSDLDSAKVGAMSWNSIKYKDQKLAGVLWIFLWWAWIHKFYLWMYIQWILYLVFIWTFIPAIIGLFEWISYFSYSKEYWDFKFNGIWIEPNEKNKKFFSK
jgi:TM2 domain-containing membrane protein YozV